MWTLHLLAARRASQSGIDSTAEPEAADGPDPSRRPRSKRRRASLPPSAVKNEDTGQRLPSKDETVIEEHDKITPWGFTSEEVERFPALKKRNFWCIQRHSATAMHYDLRMQVDGGTVSWAVPKGLIGISKNGESSRMAVETTIHPISYTTYEGADGRNFSGGRKGGTREYVITRPSSDEDSSDEKATLRRKRRYASGDISDRSESDDREGKYQEDLFRQGLYRPIRYGKSRSIHFILRGGRKMTDHSFILILAASSKTSVLSANGTVKKTWFLRLPRGIDKYIWDRGGEDGDHWGRSVKTGRTFKEVCAGYTARPERWESEKERFKDWFGDVD